MQLGQCMLLKQTALKVYTCCNAEASGIIKCYTLLFLAVGTTSSAGSSSAEAEALKLALEYLVNSMDTTSLLPTTLSRGLIREQQKAECVSEPNPY